ncbi:MAG: glycosyltransferase family 61 protein, partial [Armatimonadetes bacterium]|nr:glycosyltransferase family 61 protein [Akkermansiaceae bacterium]
LRKNFAPYLGNARSGPPVFLTRRGGARIPDNIDTMEAAFQSNGFEIVDCGTHSVRQQIRKVSSAPAVAGLHGAAMTNLLWAPPETPILEIFQPGYLNGCYEQIALEGGLEYTCLINSGQQSLDFAVDWIADIA